MWTLPELKATNSLVVIDVDGTSAAWAIAPSPPPPPPSSCSTRLCLPGAAWSSGLWSWWCACVPLAGLCSNIVASSRLLTHGCGGFFLRGSSQEIASSTVYDWLHRVVCRVWECRIAPHAELIS